MANERGARGTEGECAGLPRPFAEYSRPSVSTCPPPRYPTLAASVPQAESEFNAREAEGEEAEDEEEAEVQAEGEEIPECIPSRSRRSAASRLLYISSYSIRERGIEKARTKEERLYIYRRGTLFYYHVLVSM